MKIVIAPDSFKGSLSAIGVSEALAKGVLKAAPTAEIVKLPMADGGEGTVEALVSSTQGTIKQKTVHDPLGKPVKAFYGILGNGKTAAIEMASASGLPLVPPDKRNPLNTTTFGTGELILAAAAEGCRDFIIGIGGSATTDGGSGMAQALGAKFFDRSGAEIRDFLRGGLLDQVGKIDLSGVAPFIRESHFTVACDVDNPLLGPKGCARIYGPQKGASPEIVEQLETNMTIFAEVLERTLGREVRNVPGAGAAGGLGAGLIAFTGAELKLGIEIVLAASHFAEKIKGASLILTGEGRIDFQTAFGKTLSGIAREAKKQSIPVIGIGGMVDADIDNLYDLGMTSFFSICNQPMDLQQAMDRAPALLETVAERILRVVLFGRTENS